LFVIGLEHVVSDLDLTGKRCRLELQFLYRAFLIIDIGQAASHGLRRKCSGLNRAVELLQGHVAAQAGFVTLGVHALSGQQDLVLFIVESTVWLHQTRDLHDALLQYLIRYGQLVTRDFGSQRTLCDQIVEHGALGFRRIEHLGVELAAEHLTHAFQLLALSGVQFFLGDGLTGHLGHGIVAIGKAAIPFQAEKSERRKNKQQQQKLLKR